ncbi:MAG: CotH kinase family protein [Planctomycetes bacterium]|nr:CotH kinase family protein [Planctomycetota bacterium]
MRKGLRIRAVGVVLCGLALAVWIPAARADVVINEVLAGNGLGIKDADGERHDWIELFNAGPAAVNLEGFALADDPAPAAHWIFPSVTIGPGEFLLVWASGKDRRQAPFHVDFRLDPDGEFLGLYAPDGTPVDQLSFGDQRTDISFGRKPDGAADWYLFANPTPGTTNNASAGTKPPAAAPRADPPGGVFGAQVAMRWLSAEAREIRYTTDGSEPDAADPLFGAPIDIKATTTVRARGFAGGAVATRTGTYTFFVKDELIIPAMTISTAPANLWDATIGIYANATRTGTAWERPAAYELYRADGMRIFGVDCGLRMHGGASRDRSEKKSFKVYFRADYGPTRLRVGLFPESDVASFDSLILRAGYNDSWRHWSETQRKNTTYLKDQLIRDLHRDAGHVASHGTWVSLYVNGRYWGLYNPVERIDEDYLASYYGWPTWEIVKDGGVAEPDIPLREWGPFLSWIRTADLTKLEVYEEACSKLDVENFTTYVLLNIWAMNLDWPHHNWYAARETHPDGQWRFFHWDAEQVFGAMNDPLSATEDTVSRVLADGGGIGVIFAALTKSPYYRRYLVDRSEKLFESVLSIEHLRARHTRLIDAVRPEMAREAARWPGKTVAAWDIALARCDDFFVRREPYIRPLILQRFLEPEPGPPIADPVPLRPGIRVAFLVRTPDSPRDTETGIRDRLVARGAEVTLLDPTLDDPAAVAAGNTILVVSASVTSTSVADSYAALPIPRIILDPDVMEGANEGIFTTGSSLGSQRGIRVTDIPHPITSGLPVGEYIEITTQTESYTIGRGDLAPGARILATGVNATDYSVVAVEPGAELLDGRTASARIAFLPFNDRMYRSATGYAAILIDQAVDWAIEGAGPPPVLFVRADMSGDGTLDLGDAVQILNFIIGGGAAPPCEDTADADDDGILTIGDGMYLLMYLFSSGNPPPAPFPDPGFDPTVDAIPCEG